MGLKWNKYVYVNWKLLIIILKVIFSLDLKGVMLIIILYGEDIIVKFGEKNVIIIII